MISFELKLRLQEMSVQASTFMLRVSCQVNQDHLIYAPKIGKISVRQFVASSVETSSY